MDLNEPNEHLMNAQKNSVKFMITEKAKNEFSTPENLLFTKFLSQSLAG